MRLEVLLDNQDIVSVKTWSRIELFENQHGGELRFDCMF